MLIKIEDNKIVFSNIQQYFKIEKINDQHYILTYKNVYMNNFLNKNNNKEKDKEYHKKYYQEKLKKNITKIECEICKKKYNSNYIKNHTLLCKSKIDNLLLN